MAERPRPSLTQREMQALNLAPGEKEHREQFDPANSGEVVLIMVTPPEIVKQMKEGTYVRPEVRWREMD